MELVTPGANGHPLPSSAPAAISPQAVVQHLTDLLEVTLGASPEDLESHDSLFSLSRKQDTLQRCTRFASESQVALYVQKDIIEPKTNGVAVDGDEQASTFGKHKLVISAIYLRPSRKAIFIQVHLVLRNIVLPFYCDFCSFTQTAAAH